MPPYFDGNTLAISDDLNAKNGRGHLESIQTNFVDSSDVTESLIIVDGHRLILADHHIDVIVANNFGQSVHFQFIFADQQSNDLPIQVS